MRMTGRLLLFIIAMGADASIAAAQTGVRITPVPKEDVLIARAKEYFVTILLADGPSARFDGIISRPDAVCGFIRAKNMIGRKLFVYVTQEYQGWIIDPGKPGPHDGLPQAKKHCKNVPGFKFDPA